MCFIWIIGEETTSYVSRNFEIPYLLKMNWMSSFLPYNGSFLLLSQFLEFWGSETLRYSCERNLTTEASPLYQVQCSHWHFQVSLKPMTQQSGSIRLSHFYPVHTSSDRPLLCHSLPSAFLFLSMTLFLRLFSTW